MREVRISCLISEFALFLWRKQSPMGGCGKTFMTMKFSRSITSATSNSKRTVPMGCSSCPFATMIWKLGAGPVSLMASLARSLILLRSAPEIALVRAPVSMSPSRVSFSKSIGR